MASALLPRLFCLCVVSFCLPSAGCEEGLPAGPLALEEEDTDSAGNEPSEEKLGTGGSGELGASSRFECDPTGGVDPGPAPLQRLTPSQYRATARELFGAEIDLSGVLPPEASAGHIGLAQADPSQVDVEAYATAAAVLAQYVAADTPRFAQCAGNGGPEGECDATRPGLRRAYYSGEWSALPDFEALQPEQVDVADSIGVGPYAGGDRFGLVFTGYLAVDVAGNYDFELGSDDGSRLFLDGALRVDNDGDHSYASVVGSAALQEGHHALRLEFFEDRGDERLSLRFRRDGAEFLDLPSAALSHSSAGGTDCAALPDGGLAPDPDGASARECARAFVGDMGPRIYRSPLSERDTEALLAVFDVGHASGGYSRGVQLTVRAMLESPRFLYRPEFGDARGATDTALALSDHELATRLSFAFWNQGPDLPLLQSAEEGALSTPEGLAEQASRLMADVRARDSFRNFLYMWFGLTDLPTLEKDPRVFPDWTGETSSHMQTQADAFFDRILFGVPGTLESLFELDPAEDAPVEMHDWYTGEQGASAGLLTLPALLASHSKPDNSFPIYRGLLVREQLLCQTLPPPPANVGEPPEPEEGVSNRARFQQHSSDPGCQGCHRLIDPLGFAFENYDAIGRYRSSDEGHPVDPAGELTGTDVDGPFSTLDELAAMLATSESVRACAARQWFRHVMQRFERPADGCSMRALSEAFDRASFRFDALRLAMVETPAFRMRRPIEADPQDAQGEESP